MALVMGRPPIGNNIAPGSGCPPPFDIDLLCAKLEAWRLQQEAEQLQWRRRYNFGANVGVGTPAKQQHTIPLEAGKTDTMQDARVDCDSRRPKSNATFDRRSMAFMNIEDITELHQDSDGYLISPKTMSKRRSKTLSFHMKKSATKRRPVTAASNSDLKKDQLSDEESLQSFEKTQLTNGLRSRSLLNLNQLFKKDKTEVQSQEVDEIVLDEQLEDLRAATAVNALNHSRQKSLPVDMLSAGVKKDEKEKKRRTFMGLFKKS